MSKKYPLLDDKEWLEEKYLGEMLSPREIAEIVGCGRKTVSIALRYFCFPIRTISEAWNCNTYKKYPKLFDKEWLEKKYLEEKLNTYQIAEIVGCSRQPVGDALRRFNISMRTQSEACRKYIKLTDKRWLEQKYLEEKLSAPEIAKIIGCSHAPVLIALKHFSIQIRSQSESHKGKHHTEEAKIKCSESQKGEKNHNYGKTMSEGQKQKISDANKGRIPWIKGKHHTEEAKQKNREARKHQKFPKQHTKPEKIWQEIAIDKHSLPFKYTGDSSFWIGKKPAINPDFIHLTKKIAVEIFSYWHDPLKRHCKVPYSQTYEGRKKILKKYGWKMIVFWQDDLEQEDAEKHILRVLKEEKAI